LVAEGHAAANGFLKLLRQMLDRFQTPMMLPPQGYADEQSGPAGGVPSFDEQAQQIAPPNKIPNHRVIVPSAFSDPRSPRP
jgi:hypothetical protein